MFDDTSTADVVLHLQQEESSVQMEQDRSEYSGKDVSRSAGGEGRAVYVHAQVLAQCRYFDALLSDRWLERGTDTTGHEENGKSKLIRINLCVGAGRFLGSYLTTLHLLYSKDFVGTIRDVETALNILPIAAELLYDDCISACVKFLEAVAWTKEEEQQIVQLVTCLQLEESSGLLARLSPVKVGESSYPCEISDSRVFSLKDHIQMVHIVPKFSL